MHDIYFFPFSSFFSYFREVFHVGQALYPGGWHGSSAFLYVSPGSSALLALLYHDNPGWFVCYRPFSLEGFRLSPFRR